MPTQMLRGMCVRAADQSDLRDVHGVFHQPRLASIYLVAVIILGIILAIITVRAHTILWKFFQSTMT